MEAFSICTEVVSICTETVSIFPCVEDDDGRKEALSIRPLVNIGADAFSIRPLANNVNSRAGAFSVNCLVEDGDGGRKHLTSLSLSL